MSVQLDLPSAVDSQKGEVLGVPLTIPQAIRARYENHETKLAD
jgi:hypothetical protein